MTFRYRLNINSIFIAAIFTSINVFAQPKLNGFCHIESKEEGHLPIMLSETKTAKNTSLPRHHGVTVFYIIPQRGHFLQPTLCFHGNPSFTFDGDYEYKEYFYNHDNNTTSLTIRTQSQIKLIVSDGDLFVKTISGEALKNNFFPDINSGALVVDNTDYGWIVHLPQNANNSFLGKLRTFLRPDKGFLVTDVMRFSTTDQECVTEDIHYPEKSEHYQFKPAFNIPNIGVMRKILNWLNISNLISFCQAKSQSEQTEKTGFCLRMPKFPSLPPIPPQMSQSDRKPFCEDVYNMLSTCLDVCGEQIQKWYDEYCTGADKAPVAIPVAIIVTGVCVATVVIVGGIVIVKKIYA